MKNQIVLNLTKQDILNKMSQNGGQVKVQDFPQNQWSSAQILLYTMVKNGELMKIKLDPNSRQVAFQQNIKDGVI